MLRPMARVQIIGTKPRQTKTVALLHRLGLVQIDVWHEARLPSQQRLAHDEETVQLRERLAYAAARVDAVLATLPRLESHPSPEYETHASHSPRALLDIVEVDLAQVRPKVQSLTTRHDRLENQLGALPRYEATLRQLLPLMPVAIDLEHYTVTAIWLERHYQMALDTITQQLEDLTGGLCEIISRKVDHDILAAILVFPKPQAGAVNKLLGQKNISQIRLPAEFADQPLEQALTEIRQRLQEIPRQLSEIDSQQAALAQRWSPRLLAWQALLRNHLAQIDVGTNFGQTDYTFVIEGWAPKDEVAALQTALTHEVGDEIVLTVLPLRPEDEAQAPVAFANPAFARPFEPLVGLMALPKPDGFDPTLLMAIFLPLFFGLILGDIAYGLILFGVMVYLRRRFWDRHTLRSLAEVLMIGSLWGVVFGILFGEFFGTLGESVGIHPLWFDRGHNVQALFLLAIGIGAGHVILGLGLGVWQAVRHHHRHDLIEKGAMLISLIALFFLTAVLAGYLPASFFTPTIALLLVGVALLIYSLGGLGVLLGPLELLGTIGNILSYLRIAAIGLSSVYLAQVANELAGISGNILIGLIIATLFHALNIALGAFSPTIQSLRLHYVEFFTKFYQGGGEPFRPFQRANVRR